jgi:YfiH family protein
VALSRRVLANQLNRPADAFRMMRQVHGTTIVYRSDAVPDAAGNHARRTRHALSTRRAADAVDSVPVADAQWTDRPGLVLIANVADCCPVIVSDPVAGIVGIAHSGWRGTVGEVAPALVRTLCATGATNLRVWIGPCAEGEAYEVGHEVFTRFDRWPTAGRAHPERPGKYLLDVREVVRLQIRAEGIDDTRITVSGGGTIGDRRYHSHRRDSFGAGRMAAFVSITPD